MTLEKLDDLRYNMKTITQQIVSFDQSKNGNCKKNW